MVDNHSNIILWIEILCLNINAIVTASVLKNNEIVKHLICDMFNSIYYHEKDKKQNTFIYATKIKRMIGYVHENHVI